MPIQRPFFRKAAPIFGDRNGGRFRSAHKAEKRDLREIVDRRRNIMRYLKEFAEVIPRRQPDVAETFNEPTDRAEELEHAQRKKAERDRDTDDMAAVNLFHSKTSFRTIPAAITATHMKTIKPQKEKSSLSSKLNLFISETP